ncbi:MAG TPA: carbohydrate kinase [Pyrinomonadaceae bacterium]|jgi:fructokinase
MFNVIGIGEILWDLLPGGKTPGGAPANFAYVANALGDRGLVLSRVGDDPLGNALARELESKNLARDFLQIDPANPTGVVKVRFENDQPRYEIVAPSAWDFLELSAGWRALAARADAVCFGSLAQRSPVSRAAILEFVGLTRGLRIFDVNLRQDFYSPEILRKSFEAAHVAKLNDEELPIVAGMFDIKKPDAVETARALRAKFDLRLISVTRGASGSLLVTDEDVSENEGLKTKVADPIGAGDAFTAALAHGLLRGRKLDKTNEFANRVGAFVASRAGAMPAFPAELAPNEHEISR